MPPPDTDPEPNPMATEVPESLRRRALDEALAIARRIAAEAMWDGDACTWSVRTIDRSAPWSGVLVTEVAGGSVYQGTAGIALAFAELARLTQDHECRRMASGAVRHAINSADRMPAQAFSFHSGRVGIAYVAARAATCLGREELVADARRVVLALSGHEHMDEGLDVIGGAAGAIAPLLQLVHLLDEPCCAEIARGLAEQLLRRARPLPQGWAWPHVAPGQARELAGLAHGASGVVVALLETYRQTGDSRFLLAAREGLAFERDAFDATESNWLDFRNLSLSKAFASADPRSGTVSDESLRSALPYRRHHMHGWCHGAPGIALARMRYLSLTDDRHVEREALVAVESTVHSLDRIPDASLCHGFFGNIEPALDGARLFGRLDWHEHVLSLIELRLDAQSRAGIPWPSGVPGGASDPSLLLGDAGIALQLLRLHDRATPSILMLTPGPVRATATVVTPDPVREYLAIRSPSPGARMVGDAIGRFFSQSLQVVTRLGLQDAIIAALDDDSSGLGTTARIATALGRLLADAPPSIAEHLTDATRVELTRYRLFRDHRDYGGSLVEVMTALRAAQDLDEDSMYTLDPATTLVEQRCDWESWLATSTSTAPPVYRHVPDLFALTAVGPSIVVRRLPRLVQAMLTVLAQPGTESKVADELRAMIAEPSMDEAHANGVIREQLRAALATRLVRRADA